jgi:hypothetical protein
VTSHHECLAILIEQFAPRTSRAHCVGGTNGDWPDIAASSLGDGINAHAVVDHSVVDRRVIVRHRGIIDDGLRVPGGEIMAGGTAREHVVFGQSHVSVLPQAEFVIRSDGEGVVI